MWQTFNQEIWSLLLWLRRLTDFVNGILVLRSGPCNACTNACTLTMLHCLWYTLGTGWVWRQYKKSLLIGPGWQKNENMWKSLGCVVVNGVPRKVPRPTTLGACGPSRFGLGTSLGTPITTLPLRLFHTFSHYFVWSVQCAVFGVH